MPQIPQPTPDELAWFFTRVSFASSGCWLWRGCLSGKGYGCAYNTSAHRATYIWFKGEIPHGYHVDHLCRVRHCVNPDHLEAVTPGDNVRRGTMLRTTCKSGRHPRGDRLYEGRHWGTCRLCRLESRERWLNKTRRWRVAREVA
jgi:hypothetical protein